MKKLLLSFFSTVFVVYASILILSVNAFCAEDSEMDFKSSFGGSDVDIFNSVVATEDGYVAVGRSCARGVNGMYYVDAIIVKYDENGNVQWKKNFGGGYDDFNSVAVTEDGYLAVGYSGNTSFGNGDWSENIGKGNTDAIIVKFDKSGNVIWKSNFGGNDEDCFYSITSDDDGYVAVGSFGYGDYHERYSEGTLNAVMVKYDKGGNIIWEKKFGGRGFDVFYSVIATEDGFVTAGASGGESFGNGDWRGVNIKIWSEAIIVKYDKSGNVVWKKSFGGEHYDWFNSIAATVDGYVVVGYSGKASFNKFGDWAGVSGKGEDDAIIVKYDKNGNVIWKKNFGCSGLDIFNSVTATKDGYVVAGKSESGHFGNGDWLDVDYKGYYDAIIVKFGKNGKVIWKKNFGGKDTDEFNSVIATEDGCVAVGYSSAGSFSSGDWGENSGNGNDDAIIVKYTIKDTAPANNTISASIPTFKVQMNGVLVDNENLKYPFIVCNDITYFPMTYFDSRFLGIGTNYAADTGLQVFRLETCGEYKSENGDSVNPSEFEVKTAAGNITVNGKSIDNSGEEYPLLILRDVTYFPMTWRFCVDEFGWSYNFDSINGLVINTN